MRTLFFALSFALVTASLPCFADPPPSETLKMNAPSPPPPSIFAYPGQACPGGSEMYKGPEQELAAKSGAIYCRFVRKVIVFSKKVIEKCPPGMKPYSGAAKPEQDVIWCEYDPTQKIIIPPPPPQPKLTKPAQPTPPPPPMPKPSKEEE